MIICKFCAKPLREDYDGPEHTNDRDAVLCFLQRVAEGELPRPEAA